MHVTESTENLFLVCTHNPQNKSKFGTLSAIVGQMFPPVPQINVGRRFMSSAAKLMDPTLNGGEWGGDG